MDTVSNLLLCLSKLSHLTDGFEAELSTRVRRYRFRKGSPLKSSGSAHSLWFVQSGMLKGSYFDENGKEHVNRFWKENEIVVIKPSAYYEIYSAEYLIMLENTTLFFLSNKDAAYLMDNFTEAHKIARIIIRQDRDQAELLSYLLRLPVRQAPYTEVPSQLPISSRPFSTRAFQPYSTKTRSVVCSDPQIAGSNL